MCMSVRVSVCFQGSTITLWTSTPLGFSSGICAPAPSNSQKPLRSAPVKTSCGPTSRKVKAEPCTLGKVSWPWANGVLLCFRLAAGASARVRRGVLAADGGVLERRPFPEAPAGHRAAQPAEHHGPPVRQFWPKEREPRGLELTSWGTENGRTFLCRILRCSSRTRDFTCRRVCVTDELKQSFLDGV